MSSSPLPSAAGPPRVLFVGDDATSPQIAASLLRDLAGDKLSVRTAGTEPLDPGGRSDEMLVAMGLNPAEEKRLTAGALHTADRVVVLSPTTDVARLPGPVYEEWDLAHDDLIDRVQALSDALTTAPTRAPRSRLVQRLRQLLQMVRRRKPGA